MGGRARILLVDDRAANLVALEAILAPLNQIIVLARSGKQALAELATQDFAVVLLDIMMPGMDGFETADRIRRGTRNADVPIIFLTAASTRLDFSFRGYSAGAVDYLAKPFDPWVLTAKVGVFVSLYLKYAELTDKLSGHVTAVEEAATALAGIPSVAKDPETEDALARLLRRVGKLRAALGRRDAGTPGQS
jgi:CheY-like chemotaxis protein